MNNKFSIGVVIAIVLQVSAFVWWTAQQAQTITQLESEMAELTARTAVEKEVTLINDVKQLRKDLDDLKEKTLEGILEIDNMRISEDNRLGEYIDRRLSDLIGELQATFAQHESWIDEIEKGIGGDDNDGGTARRVLGTLLTWMAENKEVVFLVATSNDISRLPPELIRKGRLDEIFFVDLPSDPVREIIFRIHLEKRGHAVSQFNCTALSQASDGFTGAEIEQAVVSAGYTARAREEALDTSHLLEEIANTVPLSVTMSESLAALRHWCDGRAVPAD